MGGNAVPGVRRWEASEFGVITEKAMSVFGGILGKDFALEVVRSYASKESFGDLDILVTYFGESADVPDWKSGLMGIPGLSGVLNNGKVLSLGFEELQCDLIFTDKEELPFSREYYAWNDLGNLIGRVARRLGLKHGHDGLWKMVRDPENEGRTSGEVLVTRDYMDALAICGYDPDAYKRRIFARPEEIYEFAASSIYFDPDAFRLENRNYRARVRDRKRKMYSNFLDWMESIDWPEPIKKDHDQVVRDLFVTHPNFKYDYLSSLESMRLAKLYRTRVSIPALAEEFGVVKENYHLLAKHMKKYQEQITSFESDEQAILFARKKASEFFNG